MEAPSVPIAAATTPDVVMTDGTQTLVDIPTAARMAGVSIRTVYNWIARDRVAVRYTPSGKRRVVVSSLWRDVPTPEMANAAQRLRRESTTA